MSEALRPVARLVLPRLVVVNATAGDRRRPLPLFADAVCDLNPAISRAVNRNIKSAGKRSRFRFTCSFRRLVVTP